MNRRKAILKNLVAKQGASWNDAPPRLQSCEGDAAVGTQNTVYRFHDGICFAIGGRNQRAASSHDIRVEVLSSTEDCIGMRIVAWLVDHDTNHPSLSTEWKPGACAVLWRPASLALTSPTVQFKAAQEERYRPERAEPSVKRTAPPSYRRPSNESMTRINVAAPKSEPRLKAMALTARLVKA